MKSAGIFVSYAHLDAPYIERLETHLSPYLRKGHVRLWSDKDIRPGDLWADEIKTAMDGAKVAVLMVSANFLASDYIRTVELPYLVDRARQGLLRLIPISVGYGADGTTELAQYQFANDPGAPLESLSSADQNAALAKAAALIDDTFTMAHLAFGLNVIDDTTEPMEARVEARPEREDHEYGIKADYRAEQDVIAFSNMSLAVTIDDIQKLSPEDREYIADLEDTMGQQYNRWKTVKAQLGNVGGALDHEVNEALKLYEGLMCQDLNKVLDFIAAMLGGALEDHYGRYRSICDRL